MKFNFYNTLILYLPVITLGWCLLGIMQLIIQGMYKDRNFLLIMGLLFSLNIPNLGNISIIFRHYLAGLPYLTGPFLWLYGKSIMYVDDFVWKKESLHLTPFTLWTIIFIIVPEQQLFLTGLSGHLQPTLLMIVFGLGNAFSLIFYGILLLKSLQLLKVKSVNFFSSKKNNNRLTWLKYLTWIYLVLFSLIILTIIFSPVVFGRQLFPIALLHMLPATIFTYVFLLFATSQINLRVLENQEAKYQRSGLSKSEEAELMLMLQQHLDNFRSYLNPDLKLADLAKELKVSKHHLSQAINAGEGQNFFNLINEYRLKEFLKALQENQYPNYSLTGVAFESGFNSISTFYSCFKKKTGLTPKQYFSTKK